MRWLLLKLMGLYQLAVSPWLGPCCRFRPSCSAYSMEAVRIHGCVRGVLLGAWRIARCHPFHPGGFDPVPETVPESMDEPPSEARTRRK